MSTPIKSIIKNALHKKDDDLSILTFLGKKDDYLVQLSKTGHQFYIWRNGVKSQWNPYLEKPNNICLLNATLQEVPLHLNINVIICTDIAYFDNCQQLSIFYHIPIIMVFYEAPSDDFKKYKPTEWASLKNLDGHTNVFLSERDATSWEKVGYYISLEDEKFIDKWQNTLYDTAKTIYTRI
jgi:hypothetical protein